jgi:hypothetical protein
MKINKEQLLAIIHQEIEAVLEELGLILPLPLPAEPTVMENKQSRVSKVVGILNQLEESERLRVFRAFRVYTYSQFLQQISAYERAKDAK